MTTRMSGGTAATKRANSSGSTTVDVGLLGLHTKISRVRSVIAATIASRSKVWSRSGTCTGTAPATRTCSGYTSKLRQPNTTSSPTVQVIWISCWHRLTDPQPTAIRSGGTSPPAAEVTGQVLFECDVAVVGITVDGLGRRGDGLPHARQRTVHGLVAGQLDRAGHGLTGGVGRDIGQFGTQARGHRAKSRGSASSLSRRDPSLICGAESTESCGEVQLNDHAVEFS